MTPSTPDRRRKARNAKPKTRRNRKRNTDRKAEEQRKWEQAVERQRAKFPDTISAEHAARLLAILGIDQPDTSTDTPTDAPTDEQPIESAN